MNNEQAVRNFMYFSYNFDDKQLNEVLKSTGLYDHFRAKYKGYVKRFYGDGTRAFIYLYMQMSPNNQDRAVKRINEVYQSAPAVNYENKNRV